MDVGHGRQAGGLSYEHDGASTGPEDERTSGVGCGWLINFDLAEGDYAARRSVLTVRFGAALRQFALKMVDPGGAEVRGAHAAAIDFGRRKNEPTVGGGGREVFTRLVGFFHGFSQFDELRGLLDGYFVSGFAFGLEGLQVGLMLFQSPQNLHFVTCEQVKPWACSRKVREAARAVSASGCPDCISSTWSRCPFENIPISRERALSSRYMFSEMDFA